MITKATMADLSSIMDIYSYAREFMKTNSNPHQWGDNRPSKERIVEDVTSGNSYVIMENEKVCGVFVFIVGEDPTYKVIEDGRWPNEAKYGTIHRIASNGKVKGVFNKCIEYCSNKCDNLRIDTHKDNKIMINLIEKAGFERCGTIYVDDGTPRIAYQKTNPR